MAEPFVCTTGSYKNEITARDCAFALSIRDEKIYKTDTTFQGIYEDKKFEVVDTGCAEGTLFDDLTGSNMEKASECAQRLNYFRKLAGNAEEANFVAVPFKERSIFSDSWLVIKIDTNK